MTRRGCRGVLSPKKSVDGSRCHCGVEIDSATIDRHIFTAHMVALAESIFCDYSRQIFRMVQDASA
jgi:hypothetical protein